ncbi:hypothetical protein GA0074696_3612 [Micromonospora purpureochromogenes]|uniref:Uncharacterized protein n=1 Tax=Micromonospora purpureochromogenes TaxID=47872 RepID=A0A1C4YS27_9ACTN|nr:hypothetical protein [Micromonospora purpureochromogenes]SCF23131.1 hypothetical protein GA0074696_3612 [Micromonospora purpureochromogenes]
MSARPRKRRLGGPQRSDSERAWSVDDALRQYNTLLDWLRTGDGTRGVYLAYDQVYLGNCPAPYAAESDRWTLAELSASDSAAAIAETPPMWCDPPMVAPPAP